MMKNKKLQIAGIFYLKIFCLVLWGQSAHALLSISPEDFSGQAWTCGVLNSDKGHYCDLDLNCYLENVQGHPEYLTKGLKCDFRAISGYTGVAY